MGHVLGLVNLKEGRCKIECNKRIYANTLYRVPSGCSNKAVEEYKKLNLPFGPLSLDPGSCAHWSVSQFQDPTTDEMMSPKFERNRYQPITRVTVGALDEVASDYVVDYDAADPYPYVKDPNSILPAALKPSSTFTLNYDVIEHERRRLYVNTK